MPPLPPPNSSNMPSVGGFGSPSPARKPSVILCSSVVMPKEITTEPVTISQYTKGNATPSVDVF